MIITQILGPTKVIIFVLAQKVITLPLDLVYMITAPFVPAFGEAKARNDWQWIKRAYRNATLASLAIGLPVMLMISTMAKPLIRVWAGPAAVPDTSLIFWLSAYNLFGLLIMVTGQLLTWPGTGKCTCGVTGLMRSPWHWARPRGRPQRGCDGHGSRQSNYLMADPVVVNTSDFQLGQGVAC